MFLLNGLYEIEFQKDEPLFSDDVWVRLIWIWLVMVKGRFK